MLSFSAFSAQDTGDAGGAFERMPRSKTRECLLLKALKRHGGARDASQGAHVVFFARRRWFERAYTGLLRARKAR